MYAKSHRGTLDTGIRSRRRHIQYTKINECTVMFNVTK